MFDAARRITLDATVKELQWTAPHAWLHVWVSNQAGAREQWGVEMGAPLAMIREGWKKNSVQPGDRIKVTINPLRNGEPGGNLVAVVRADGTPIGRAPPELAR